MLSLLKKTLKSLLVPSSLLVLSKFLGLFVAFSYLNISPTIDNYSKNFWGFSIQLSNSTDILISNSIANIFMLVITGFYFLIWLIITFKASSLFNKGYIINRDYPKLSLKDLNFKTISLFTSFIVFFLALSLTIFDSITQSASIVLGFISIVLIFYSTRLLINLIQRKFHKSFENDILLK